MPTKKKIISRVVITLLAIIIAVLFFLPMVVKNYTIKNSKELVGRVIDFDNPNDIVLHKDMVSKVEKMLEYHRELPSKTGNVRKLWEKKIKDTDDAIDQLVYQLNGLTEDEIKIVEGT